jgi:hypothetical protein
LLAGCGGSQPPIGAPGAMPQRRAATTPANRAESWMLPEAKSEDLLYASNTSNEVFVYSYPTMVVVGELSLPQNAWGVCSDKQGHVFVTTMGSISKSVSTVYEYAHGGTKPIQSLTDPGLPNSCAIDPSTGNLAVTNWFGNLGSFDHGNVAVFTNATGNASVYYDPDIYWYWWCTYDSSGNLYVDGYNEGGAYPFGELPKGSASFIGITFNSYFDAFSLQWVSGNLIVSTADAKKSPEDIYRIELDGSNGTIVGSTALYGHHDRNPGNVQYLIDRDRIIGPRSPARLALWHYPAGGDPIRVAPNKAGPYGVALSLAPP